MLVEREAQLARLAALLEEAAAGAGRLVLLGGEAGVGKSSLTTALVATCAGRLTVRRGACDAVGPAAALGPLIDAFPELTATIEQATGVDRPGLFRRLRTALATAPTLLVLEDVHWADEATLDMLRFLGRRLAGLPLLVVATYRDDEAPAGSQLALLLGDLATAAGVTRLTLPALTEQGVRRLAESAGSSLDPAALHRSTEGNPFYVTEVLAGGDAPLPATVRDAVLARVSRLSTPAQQVLAAAAVLGQRADLRLLTTVSGSPAGAVDACIRAGVLVGDGDQGWGFRHELARLAIDQALAPGTRAGLHAVALRVLRDGGDRDDGRLAHHAAASGDRDAVLLHAERAAARSARLGAHREAAALYRLALRFAGPSEPRRSRLAEGLSYECYLTNEVEEAHAARLEALAAARATGEQEAVGANLRWLSRLSWSLGDRAGARRLGAEAVATLERADSPHELAMAYANLATLGLLGEDVDAAVAWGERAIDLARAIGDPQAEMHALISLGTALAGRHDGAAGAPMLRRGLELALRYDDEEAVGRAYRNLTACGLANREYAEVAGDIAAGIAYCRERDFDMAAVQVRLGLSRLLAEQGRLAEAEESLAWTRSEPRLVAANRMAIGHTLGMLAARREGVLAPELEESWRLAEWSGEPQQIVAVACVRAEALWLGGCSADVVAETGRVWPSAVAQGNPWYVGELSWWLAAAGARRDPPARIAEPFRLLLAGQWRAAAAAWEEIGCPLWTAYALGRSPDLADARRAVAIADGIGAPAARRAILRDRQARGLPVPVGPRAATRANPARLTTRELEVLRQLAEGLSNPEIAQRLYLSERTVAHHVSAVLQKLGEPTRSRAVATAVRRGIVAHDGGA